MKETMFEFQDLEIPEDELDKEWAHDWLRIREVYRTIEKLEGLLGGFDVSYLRELSQKSLILNLKKYAWSLQGFILEKYGDIINDVS